MVNYLGTFLMSCLPWIIWEKFTFYDYHGGGRNKQQGQQPPGRGKNQSHRYDCTGITSESRNKVNTIFLASVLG